MSDQTDPDQAEPEVDDVPGAGESTEDTEAHGLYVGLAAQLDRFEPHGRVGAVPRPSDSEVDDIEGHSFRI